MTEDRPPPLTPAGCDLAGNDWFPFYFERLRKSKWWRRASDKARASNVVLWGVAYGSVPAGSLPDDDDELAEAAGFGFDVATFIAAKAEIMAPWTLCSDGRWYHPVVCEVALDAWTRLDEKRRAAREKKAAQRDQIKRQREAIVLPVPAKNEPVLKAGAVVPGDIAPPSEDCPKIGQDKATQTGQTGQDNDEARASLSPKVDAADEKPKAKAWENDPDFVAAWDACPPQMRTRAKSRDKVWPEWRKAKAKAGSAAILVAALRRYLANDADVGRTGGPGLQLWLSDGRWEHWLPAGAQSTGSVIRPPWVGPPDIRAEVIAAARNGEGFATSWLDGCGWRDLPERAVLAPTKLIAHRLENEVGATLRTLGVAVIVETERRGA